jgi:indole-3-acetate monooxygenase
MGHVASGAELLSVAKGLRAHIISQRDVIEASRRLPEELAGELARAGFFRISLPSAYGGLPSAYGGLDMTPADGIAVFEKLAKADASVAWSVWNGNTHWTAAQLSPEATHVIHADPNVIIANSTRPSGQAQVIENGYRVTGRWSLVSGCELASWMVLWSVVHQDGKPRLASSGGPDIRFMLLPAEQCEIIDTWTVGGLRGTGSHDVAVHDAFVPAAFGSDFFDPYSCLSPSIVFRLSAALFPG